MHCLYCRSMKSKIECIEIIMKSIDYLYLLGHLPSCTIEVSIILRWNIHEIILKLNRYVRGMFYMLIKMDSQI